LRGRHLCGLCDLAVDDFLRSSYSLAAVSPTAVDYSGAPAGATWCLKGRLRARSSRCSDSAPSTALQKGDSRVFCSTQVTLPNTCVTAARSRLNRSENGNGTRTTDPVEGVTMLRLPPADSNLEPKSLR